MKRLFSPYGHRSKRRPSETENSNTNGVNGNPEPHSINGEDKTSDSNQSAEDSQKCDVRFIGEGVLIGKGALKSTTGKKLKISFDDNATFYEYPSEQVCRTVGTGFQFSLDFLQVRASVGG